MRALFCYHKACACLGASASGPRLVTHRLRTDGNLATWEVVWEPGPVCDRCNTPWKLLTEAVDAPDRTFDTMKFAAGLRHVEEEEERPPIDSDDC